MDNWGGANWPVVVVLVLAALAALVVRVLDAHERLGRRPRFPYQWHCLDCRCWGGAVDEVRRERSANLHALEHEHEVKRGAPTDGRDQ